MTDKMSLRGTISFYSVHVWTKRLFHLRCNLVFALILLLDQLEEKQIEAIFFFWFEVKEKKWLVSKKMEINVFRDFYFRFFFFRGSLPKEISERKKKYLSVCRWSQMPPQNKLDLESKEGGRMKKVK